MNRTAPSSYDCAITGRWPAACPPRSWRPTRPARPCRVMMRNATASPGFSVAWILLQVVRRIDRLLVDRDDDVALRAAGCPRRTSSDRPRPPRYRPCSSDRGSGAGHRSGSGPSCRSWSRRPRSGAFDSSLRTAEPLGEDLRQVADHHLKFSRLPSRSTVTSTGLPTGVAVTVSTSVAAVPDRLAVDGRR